MKILPDTTKISSSQREMFLKIFSLQCYFFFSPGAPSSGEGHEIQHMKSKGKCWHNGHPKQRNISSRWLWHICLGFCALWPLWSEGTWALPVGRLTWNQTHASKAVFIHFKDVAALLSGHGSTASALPSFPSPGWALGSFNVWELPFNLRFSLEKSKLFAAWLEPARSNSPVNILSFVLPLSRSLFHLSCSVPLKVTETT